MQGLLTGFMPDGTPFNPTCQPPSGRTCKNPVFTSQPTGTAEDLQRAEERLCAYHRWYVSAGR